MPELNEKDLRKLFQTAGHHVPATDLTDRIMARVAATPITRIDLAKPLISKRAWIMVGLGLVALCTVLGLMPETPDQTPGPASTVISAIEGLLSGIQMPQGSWPMWTAMAMGSLLFFAWVDSALMRSMRRTAA
ncbi:MAG: hypothetical protein ABI432_16225 [Flavobacteriales bacterium]